LTRSKNTTLKLDAGIELQIKSLSLGALEQLQSEVKKVENSEDPKAQFLPVLRAAVVGLEDVSGEEINGFLLEDLRKIADKVMEVGK